MNTVGQREGLTQQRVLRFFQGQLDYRCLGDWKDRAGNGNVEEDLLRDWLARQGHEERIIARALREVDQEAAIADSKTLYDANGAVYETLRYGFHVKPSVDEHTVTVWLIKWNKPEHSELAVAKDIRQNLDSQKRDLTHLFSRALHSWTDRVRLMKPEVSPGSVAVRGRASPRGLATGPAG